MDIHIDLQDLAVFFTLLFLAGMFTGFFGLADLWENRGSWYIVQPEQLDIVMANLHELKAFMDSDGIANESIKIKAYIDRRYGTAYYTVKVPSRVFEYEAIKLTEKHKAEMLGLHDR